MLHLLVVHVCATSCLEHELGSEHPGVCRDSIESLFVHCLDPNLSPGESDARRLA